MLLLGEWFNNLDCTAFPKILKNDLKEHPIDFSCHYNYDSSHLYHHVLQGLIVVYAVIAVS